MIPDSYFDPRESRLVKWTYIVFAVVLLYMFISPRVPSERLFATPRISTLNLIHTTNQPAPVPIPPPKSSAPDHPATVDTSPIPKLAGYDSFLDCEGENTEVFSNETTTFAEFKKCMLAHMKMYDGHVGMIEDFWEFGSKQCEALLKPEDLEITELKNGVNSSKWVILPKCRESHQLLALGVGQNIQAEQQLSQILPDVVFRGSDPITDPNQKLFSSLGQFYPFGIGKKSGTERLRVLTHENKEEYQDATVLELLFFLKEVVNLKVIDFLWVNTEGSEYQLIDYFYKDGGLEKEGRIVCQINMELHPGIVETGVPLFHSFLSKLGKEEKYLLMKGRTTSQGVFRMFLLNVKDPKCLNKYFS